jgi:hypothetical protein
MVAPLLNFTDCCNQSFGTLEELRSKTFSRLDVIALTAVGFDASASISALVFGILGTLSIVGIPPIGTYALFAITAIITLAYVTMLVCNWCCSDLIEDIDEVDHFTNQSKDQSFRSYEDDFLGERTYEAWSAVSEDWETADLGDFDDVEHSHFRQKNILPYRRSDETASDSEDLHLPSERGKDSDDCSDSDCT